MAISIDMRGHGRSSTSKDGYAIEKQAEDVAKILSSLEIERTILIGNSMGSMIALQFCLDFMDRVHSLILSSVASNLNKYFPFDNCREGWEKDYERFFSQKLVYSKRTRAERPELIECHKQVTLKMSRGAVIDCASDPKGVFFWDISKKLHKIKVPVLLIYGLEDVITPSEANKEVAKNLEDIEVIAFEDVGHAPMLGAPDKFNETVLNFIVKHLGAQ